MILYYTATVEEANRKFLAAIKKRLSEPTKHKTVTELSGVHSVKVV